MQFLIASQSSPAEIRSLRESTYQVITADGTEETEVQDAAALRALLREEFSTRVDSAEAVQLWEQVQARRG